ncbi:M15 family metallopeptidase [Roseibacterium beibuensis]|uniref:M15 family metallopeptidase n=1 Tax=[Roseibacterium] beibuensis TaxID=1193142 RepID=UPI00217DCACC|nr:M15 family metallopeptidase [Roseibacterium beibuensis]MCS6625255.1 M15 family metallopeptidase [Roseibacterium beibuensis]
MSKRAVLSMLAALPLLFGAALGADEARAQDRPAAEVCDSDQIEWGAPSLANAISHYSLEWTPFGPTEWGWETYLPLIQREIGTGCAPGSPRFARALAEFQYAHDLPPTGWFDHATFQVFRGVWQERRPFIMARVRDEPCPEPPPINQLGYLVESEEHADRLTRLLRRDVLDAYRRLVAAARAEVPEVAADPELLQIFSGFRDPEADAARCAAQGNCDGLRRAVCSPHRTGTAVDLYVGQMGEAGVDNTSPASRLHMSRSPTYRWLVQNAHRFGFVPYVYEPWHWEWVSPTGGYAGTVAAP